MGRQFVDCDDCGGTGREAYQEVRPPGFWRSVFRFFLITKGRSSKSCPTCEGKKGWWVN